MMASTFHPNFAFIRTVIWVPNHVHSGCICLPSNMQMDIKTNEVDASFAK